MSFALVRKELREHGVIMALALALGALALWALLESAEKHGGRFIALTRYAQTIGTLNALVLANRLFAREYAGRTQLFLETLPIARWRVFATKWLLGCTVMAATTVVAWFAALVRLQRSEVLPWGDALRVLSCVGLFALAVWSWSAMAGMLGRFRYLPWMVGVFLLFAIEQIVGLELYALPVFRLLGEDVQMARGMPEPRQLALAVAVVLVSVASAAALALLGSGAMASALAQRMTARERAFIGASFVAALVITSSLERKPDKPPFELKDAEHVKGAAAVSVLPTLDFSREAARDLGLQIDSDLGTLRSALGLETVPPVAIIVQQGLDRTVIERAGLDKSDGVVLRAAPDVPREALRAEVLHSVLVDATLRRAGREDRHVLLDGLSIYLTVEGDAAGRERYWLRAAAAAGPLRAAALTRWEETSEQLGTCLANAVAFAVVDVLAQQLGRARLLALMRELFAVPHDDARVLFEPEPAAQLAAAGTSWAALADRAEAALAAARAQHALALAQRPKLRARLAASSSAAAGRTIQAELHGAASYWVLYTLLRPWTTQADALARYDARRPNVVVPLSPARGSRTLAAIEVDDAVLDCPIRVLARRVRIP